MTQENKIILDSFINYIDKSTLFQGFDVSFAKTVALVQFRSVVSRLPDSVLTNIEKKEIGDHVIAVLAKPIQSS